jgi:hypothetical protein
VDKFVIILSVSQLLHLTQGRIFHHPFKKEVVSEVPLSRSKLN